MKGGGGATTVQDPLIMDIEAETDRRFLCDRILSQIDIAQARTAMQFTGTANQLAATVGDKAKSSKGMNKRKQTLGKTTGGFTEGEKVGSTSVNLENINIANYICDFGNMVVGSSKKKYFRLTNVGKIPISFQLDKKILQ
jgi:hypothetical protein